MILKQMNSANPPKLYTAAIVRQSLAEKVHSTLVVPGEHKVNCCSISDEKTKLGAHDIDYWLILGCNRISNVGWRCIVDDPPNPSFGLQVGQAVRSKGSIAVNNVNQGPSLHGRGTV